MGIIQRLRSRMRGDSTLVVENTGKVTEANGGVANSGYSGPPLRRGQRVVVKNTGAATATGEGSRANSGISYTDDKK